MRNAASISRSWWPNFKSFPKLRLKLAGIDLGLLLSVIGLVVFGLIMVYSSSFIYAQEKTGSGFFFIQKQLTFAIAGFFAMIAASQIPSERLSRSAYILLGLSIALLVAVMIPGLGARAGGAQRWLRLGAITFQPGEFAKFAIILFVARQLTQKRERLDNIVAGVFSNFVVPLPAMLLLLLQPDFGSVAIVTIVIFTMMFVGGVPKRFLGTALVLAITAGSLLAFGSSYRRSRIMMFLDPWADPSGKGFQIIQSFVGLHSGHFWGVGLGASREKLFFLPEAHNDFIFSVIGEELGFLGIIAVVLTFLFFIYRGLRTAWELESRKNDRFSALLATGITLSLGLQAFVNMSVVLGLVPTKGLNLPFISYGGSALFIDLAAFGILLGLSRRAHESR